jgi:hypothetical protein
LGVSVTIGKKIDFDSINETLKLKFTTTISSLKEDWRRCNLLANYIADYASYNFAAKDKADNLISTIINEIIESIVKISEKNASISLTIRQFGPNILVDVTSELESSKIDYYKDLIQRVNQDNIETLYYEHFNHNPKSSFENIEFGMIMLACDYHAQINATFQNNDPHVSTQIMVNSKELAE